MKIDLRSLSDETESISLCAKPTDYLQPEDGEFPGLIRGDLHLLRQGDDVHLWGHLTCPVRLECSRCLAPFEHEISVDVDLLFEREGKNRPDWGEGEVELTIDELNVISYTPPRLDCFPIIRQEILLALPMQPKCRSDCKGLCPHCGQDLNEGSCGCPDKEIDPRWEALNANRPGRTG